jgi:hypothetical protein
MGHYDDCYAADDFERIRESEKIKHYLGFREDLEKNGKVWGTLDDVIGHVLLEWAKSNNFKIERNGRSITVLKNI